MTSDDEVRWCWVLDEHNNAVPASFEDWGKWWVANIDKRRLGVDIFGDLTVSTVFLSLNKNHSVRGPPILWETLVRGPDFVSRVWRYTSVEAALEGHERISRLVRTYAEGNAATRETVKWDLDHIPCVTGPGSDIFQTAKISSVGDGTYTYSVDSKPVWYALDVDQPIGIVEDPLKALSKPLLRIDDVPVGALTFVEEDEPDSD